MAGQSGDLRRALDLGRRVLELSKFERSNTKLETSYSQLIPDVSESAKPTTHRERSYSVNTEGNGRTPRKLNAAGVECKTAVTSPRKRVQQERSREGERVPRKTPRKTSLIDGDTGLEKENKTVASRRSPRKISSAAAEYETAVISPRKRVQPLWNEESDDEGVRVLRKTPRKTLLGDDKTNLEKENKTVSSRKSPGKVNSSEIELHQPGLVGNRTYCKQLFGIQPINILTSPAKANTPSGPRKQLFFVDNDSETLGESTTQSPAKPEIRRTPRKLLLDGDRERLVKTFDRQETGKMSRRLSVVSSNDGEAFASSTQLANGRSPSDTPGKSPRNKLFSLQSEENFKSPAKNFDRQEPAVSGTRKTPRRLSVVSSNNGEPFVSSTHVTNGKSTSVTPRKSPRKKLFSLQSEENFQSPVKSLVSPRKSPRKFGPSIQASDVLAVVAQMSASARNLRAEESAFPLHQKLLICTLMLILTKGKNKDVSVGKVSH